MRKLFICVMVLVLVASLSVGAVSAGGWYGEVHTSGNVVSSSLFHGKAWGTKYLSSYTGHALVEVGVWTGSGIGTHKSTNEEFNCPYSGSVYFLAERTATGDCAYCLSEVRDSDGRTYTQHTYH